MRGELVAAAAALGVGAIAYLLRRQSKVALPITVPAKILLKVRTVTVGVHFVAGDRAQWKRSLVQAAAMNKRCSDALTALGYEVQTTRVSTNSFEEWCTDMSADKALEDFKAIDAMLVELGINLFNAGPAESPKAIALVPKLVALSPRISASGALSDPLDAPSAARLAGAILEIARTTPGGEGNFQFCASFNVAAGIPFFPAAYHVGKAPSFAIGCETAAILADALPRAMAQHAGDLNAAKAGLTRAFEEQMAPLHALATHLSCEHAMRYDGIDASIAPLGTAPPLTTSFESLGLFPSFGDSGTLAASALVTGAVKAIGQGIKLCGYTGLMLPPCEDAGLAQRGIEGTYRIHDLLAYSSVCGLGLDTVPVPGDVPPKRMTALLLDVAALAFRLNKPLTCRLFPVPGKSAGEMTSFANPYLCDTTIFNVP